ncbi:MAG: pyrroline-5-carboxylate reductase [Candidatus Omnitrophica bacterium CG11_big_fil_rev_8_21_14_0_20_42_13]|uniref:Pyrroline-5-carboxylate reductase n=1 Tax=Candidatus Ghiorseimicrobium undicola TaxID=1974746 RepID=A0A2H0LV32_9BACT|nr:MAG: pyrroline-5-carboxylate reductase [Candidatus Omnitrophica bacterium CG11_big_fil_rev_8_21_14_0_20_42_13]
MVKHEKIGIIGFGNMGLAIAERIKREHEVFVFDKDSQKIKNIPKIKSALGLADLVKKVDTVILAVKPQDFEAVLAEIKGYARGKLIISIAAGISTKYIEGKIDKVRVIRAMPNMPAQIGKGITALVKGRFAAPKDIKIAEKIFKAVGETVVMDKERLIDVVTALSGSGPAYLLFIFLALLAAAEGLGLDKKNANKLIYHTIIGSMDLLNKKSFDAKNLINKVASKGGTTEAALKVFIDRKLSKIICDAVVAAHKRAKQLSKE